MPVDRYQKIIDRGNATIYLTLRIKFRSKKRLPANPHPREIAFRMISLESQISNIHEFFFRDLPPFWIRYANAIFVSTKWQLTIIG